MENIIENDAPVGRGQGLDWVTEVTFQTGGAEPQTKRTVRMSTFHRHNLDTRIVVCPYTRIISRLTIPRCLKV